MYMKSLLLRYGSALAIAFGYELFYVVFSPLTLLGSFLVLFPFLPVVLSSNSLIFEGITFMFIPACTAASAYLLLAVLILVTKGIKFKNGLKMFLLGSLAILCMNIVRIVTLIIVYFWLGKNVFDSLHLFYWYIISTLFVVLVWIWLTKKFKVKSIPVYSDIKKLHAYL
jgi:exosortase/archaeosortase family protein